MNATLGSTLIGLLMATAQSEGDLIFTHDISPRYNKIDYESACGSTVFQVRFRNGPEERGRVDHILIDGRPVAGAAETLQMRAARRGIEGVSIMNCGMDPKRPVLMGVMNLSEVESRAAGMRWSLFFRIINKDGHGWRMTIE